MVISLSGRLARLLRALFLLAVLTATVPVPAVPGDAPGIGAESVPGAGGPMPGGPDSGADISWAGKVVAIPVKGVIIGKPISDMPDKVAAALGRAERDGAVLVVLEVDSPGGEVNACDMFAKRVYECKIPVIALVEHKAVSGGAMVASAAREIVMTRTARFGDIQPMPASLIGEAPKMDDRAAEKIEVDIRTIMKVYAENHGRPPAVFAAMVSRDMELYQVAFGDGKTEYLDGHELKLHEENIRKGREGRRIASTRILKPAGKLLELTAQQAVEFGVASEAVESVEAFYRSRGFDAEDVVRADIEAGEFDLTKLLPSLDDIGLPPWALVLLGVFLVAGVAGVITEFQMPGTGIPIAIGLIGFVAFFSTLFMYDRGSPLGIAVFLVGITLLIVEIMVLPGFGVAGILGILGILSGLFLAFTPDWNSDYMKTFMWNEVGSFAMLLFIALIGVALCIWAMAEYGHRLPLIRYFTLQKNKVGGEAARIESLPRSDAGDSPMAEAARMVGRTGIAETVLRPAGKMRLDSGKIIDVVADGLFVEPGMRIRILEAVPGRVVVGLEGEPAG